MTIPQRIDLQFNVINYYSKQAAACNKDRKALLVSIEICVLTIKDLLSELDKQSFTPTT